MDTNVNFYRHAEMERDTCFLGRAVPTSITPSHAFLPCFFQPPHSPFQTFHFFQLVKYFNRGDKTVSRFTTLSARSRTSNLLLSKRWNFERILCRFLFPRRDHYPFMKETKKAESEKNKTGKTVHNGCIGEEKN